MLLNGRPVTDVEIDGVDPQDYPEFCDAYFSYGVYEDTGEELTDAELEELLDTYPEVVNNMAFEKYI